MKTNFTSDLKRKHEACTELVSDEVEEKFNREKRESLKQMYCEKHGDRYGAQYAVGI
jgi:hypothetical protein